MVCAQEHSMKTGLNHAVRVTVAALSIVLGLGAAAPATAQCPGNCYDDGPGRVNGADLSAVLSARETAGSGAIDTDFDDDGLVDWHDLAMALIGSGPCTAVVIGWGAGVTSTGLSANYGQSFIPATLVLCTAITVGNHHCIVIPK